MINLKIRAWLYSPAGPERTVLSHLAELVAVNHGSIEASSFGRVVADENYALKRHGLSLQEAYDLTAMWNFLKGMFVMEDKASEIEVQQLIQAEVTRLESGSRIIIPTPEQTRLVNE